MKDNIFAVERLEAKKTENGKTFFLVLIALSPILSKTEHTKSCPNFFITEFDPPMFMTFIKKTDVFFHDGDLRVEFR